MKFGEKYEETYVSKKIYSRNNYTFYWYVSGTWHHKWFGG